MTKMEFLLSLHEQLKDLPQDEVEEHLNFYSEMIEDRIEEGLSEEDDVSAVGSVDEIAKQITPEIPYKIISDGEIITRRHMSAWENVLIILSSPIRISLLIAFVAIFLSYYICLSALIISFWSVFAAIGGSGFGILITGIVYICTGNQLAGIAMIGAGIFCLGLSIFAFYGCKKVTQWTLMITKEIPNAIKKCYRKKEAI